MFQCPTITVAAGSGSNDVAEMIAAIRNDKPGTCVSGLAFESACAGFEQGDTRMIRDSKFQNQISRESRKHQNAKQASCFFLSCFRDRSCFRFRYSESLGCLIGSAWGGILLDSVVKSTI